MPTPPKQFLSKGERIRNAQLPRAQEGAETAGRRFRFELREDATNPNYSTYNPRLMRKLVDKMYLPDELKELSTPAQKRGLTRPSSRRKKGTRSPVNFNAAVTGDPKNARKILEDALRKIMSPKARAAFLNKYEQAIDAHLPF